MGGNTVVMVELDMRVVAQADYVIDLGPGAGADGGRIVATGTPDQVSASTTSTTAPQHRILRLHLLTPLRTKQFAAPHPPQRTSQCHDRHRNKPSERRGHSMVQVQTNVTAT